MPTLALDPAALSAEAIDAVRELLAEGESANTRRSYQTAWRYWSAWHRLRYASPLALPLAPAAVVQFVLDHTARKSGGTMAHSLPRELDEALVASGAKQSAGPFKLSTVVQRVAAIATMHQLRRLPNPAEDPAVRQVLRHARRAHAKRGECPRKKTAAVATMLHAMLSTCDDTMLGVRDRALLCFAWATGGRRRSEVAAARVAQLTTHVDGSYTFRLAHSKTRQEGATHQDSGKPVAGIAAASLTLWLERSGVCDGAIFRRVRGSVAAEPLRPAAVAAIVQRRARLAGLDGDFAAHSLRSGFVTEAGRQAVPLPDVMDMTGHHSVQSVVGYWRTGHAQLSRVAQLLDAHLEAPAPTDVQA